jgi:hypothetical protein
MQGLYNGVRYEIDKLKVDKDLPDTSVATSAYHRRAHVLSTHTTLLHFLTKHFPAECVERVFATSRNKLLEIDAADAKKREARRGRAMEKGKGKSASRSRK